MGYRKELAKLIGFKSLDQRKSFQKAANLSNKDLAPFIVECTEKVVTGNFNPMSEEMAEFHKWCLRTLFDATKTDVFDDTTSLLNQDDLRKLAVLMAQLGFFEESEQARIDLNDHINFN
jgi:hypothetical protein